VQKFVKPALKALVAAFAAGLLASAAPAAAPKPVPVGEPTPIAAYGGRLVWSRPDGAGGFRLVQRVGGGPVTQLPIPARSVPFDVDLGPTSGGHVLAVYTRCATEPAPTTQSSPIPEYQKGRGCDVYKLDLNGGPEQPYTKVNASDATEFWPTYWKGRVGFARVYDKGPGISYVYVKDVANSHPSERLPGGPDFTSSFRCGQQPCPNVSRPVPLQLELYGSRLAFAWRYQANRGDSYELRVDTVGSKDSVVLDRGTSGLTRLQVAWPSFESGLAYWAHPCSGDSSGCTPARVRLSTSTYTGDIVERWAPSPVSVISHERASGITWVLRADSPGQQSCPCVLDPLRASYEPLR